MVFEIEGQFQQFIHCKFRENIVRLLYIPSVEDGNIFLVVNKYGKVGLYEPQKFTLLLTYILDLSVPMRPELSRRLSLQQSSNRDYQPQLPKCEKTHLIADATYASDVKSVVFASTKGILQWYDIGEIESQSIGLETRPRKQYMNLKYGVSPVPLRNKGHAETHRVFGLPEIPYCMEYSSANTTKVIEKNVEIVGKSVSKLLIGDLDGCITIISIKDPKCPFGKRKIRGKLHNIKMQDLFQSGVVKIYKAHNDLVKEIRFINPRQLIISCSRDKKFSIFVHDCTGAIDPFIISLAKGINTLAHSDALKIIATGSDDAIVRLFNQFAIKMPQMELYGHKSSVVNVEFINTAFTENPILISFSQDVEIRAWDPVAYVCLQSVYISFPIKSTIMCKTPEFGKRSLIIYQPNYTKLESLGDSTGNYLSKSGIHEEENGTQSISTTSSYFRKGQDGYIILLYCNSFAKLYIEKETSKWPFDFEDFLSEFEEMSGSYEKKMIRKHETETKDPRKLKLSNNEITDIESKLDNYVKEIMDIKTRVDKQLGAGIYDPVKKSSTVSLRQPSQAKIKEQTLPPSLLNDHNAVFKALPLYQLQPVELSTKNLPVPEVMKEEMGIDRITSTNDLFSQKAQRYFSSPANIKALSEIEEAKSKSPSIPPTPISASSKESSIVDESYRITHSDLRFKTNQDTLEHFREDDLSSISSVLSNNGVISDNDAAAASDGDVDDDDNGDIMEIAEDYDFESHDFQGKLQKMITSYQDTLQEQLQIPCNISSIAKAMGKEHRKGKKMPINASSTDSNNDLNEDL